MEHSVWGHERAHSVCNRVTDRDSVHELRTVGEMGCMEHSVWGHGHGCMVTSGTTSEYTNSVLPLKVRELAKRGVRAP